MSYLDRTFGTYIRRYIVYPVYWKFFKHANVLSYYQQLKKHQWLSRDEIMGIQQKKLYALVHYINRNIPYYQKMIQEKHLKFSEDTIFSDIKQFPILTKDIIRKNFHQLYKFRDKTYYKNTSGGSTGIPIILYQDADYFAWNTATKVLFDEWAGRKIGERMVSMPGSIQDLIKSGQGLKSYFRQQLSGVTVLKTIRMTEKDYYKYVEKINRIKPSLIFTYTHEFSRFVQEHHLNIFSPKGIMATGSVLFPEVKARIEEVFKAPIFNRYGSREVGDMACNCRENNSLHTVPDVHYLEILDDQGKEVEPGKAGNIIVTLLTNYTMPLIRYKIGDVGILSEKKCLCGRELPLMKKVVGRIRNRFKNKFGDYINAGFYSLFYFQENIKQFQLVQETINLIIINLVLVDKHKLKDMNQFFTETSKKICKIMGHQVTVKYNIVDEIKPSPSGKYMYIFSRVVDV